MSERKKELENDLDALYALRDEIRLQLHLGGQEAKQQWQKLEPQIERLQNSATQISKQSLAQLAQALREFKSGLKELSN